MGRGRRGRGGRKGRGAIAAAEVLGPEHVVLGQPAHHPAAAVEEDGGADEERAEDTEEPRHLLGAAHQWTPNMVLIVDLG